MATAFALSIALIIKPQYGGFLTALRYSTFQTASVISTTGYATADDLLKAGDQYLRDISAVSAKIENAEVRAKADKLGGTCQRIFDYVRQNPKSADGLRKFMNYYLPTLHKLLTTYELMEEQGVEGENITASKTRISQMLDTMDLAFLKQLDALFGEEAMDISTDITVLENLLRQQGFASGDQTTSADGSITLEL